MRPALHTPELIKKYKSYIAERMTVEAPNMVDPPLLEQHRDDFWTSAERDHMDQTQDGVKVDIATIPTQLKVTLAKATDRSDVAFLTKRKVMIPSDKDDLVYFIEMDDAIKFIGMPPQEDEEVEMTREAFDLLIGRTLRGLLMKDGAIPSPATAWREKVDKLRETVISMMPPWERQKVLLRKLEESSSSPESSKPPIQRPPGSENDKPFSPPPSPPASPAAVAVVPDVDSEPAM